jgi:predicted aldo/keto reductase-like oxidoreductase
MYTPKVFLEALNRFDFDTVMFPLNFVLYADPEYRMHAEELLRECHARDVGIMTIKVLAKGPWENYDKDRVPWYEPFSDPENIQSAVNFVLSQDVVGFCTTGNPNLVPALLAASENYSPLSDSEQEELIATAPQYASIFDGPKQLIQERD